MENGSALKGNWW